MVVTRRIHTEQPVDYIVYREGSMTKALNGDTGAVISSNTDSATVIQAAIDASTEGGCIKIRRGKYTISTTINVNKEVVIEGDGKLGLVNNGTQLFLENGADCDVIQITDKGSATYFTTIRNLGIHGNKANNASGNCITITGDIHDVLIENVFAYDTEDHGIEIDGGHNHEIVECWIENNTGDGVYIHSASQSDIRNCYFYDNANHVRIVGPGASYNTISNSFFNTSTSNGISLSQASGTVINGNIIINSVGEGIEIYYTENCIVDGNFIYNSSENGIYLNDGTNRFTVTGNVIRENDKHGIFVWKSLHGVITGNKFYHNSVAAANTYTEIYLDSAGGAMSADNLISNNDIEAGNAKYGVAENRAADNRNFIMTNKITGATTAAISKSGPNSNIWFNDGHATEKSGTATMLNGNASIAVAHGLTGTPTVINVTGQHGEVQSLYITAVGAANFTINTADGNVTADRDIFWDAKVR